MAGNQEGFWVTTTDSPTVNVVLLCRRTQAYDRHDSKTVEFEIVKATKDADEVERWVGQNKHFTGWWYFIRPLDIEKEIVK